MLLQERPENTLFTVLIAHIILLVAKQGEGSSEGNGSNALESSTPNCLLLRKSARRAVSNGAIAWNPDVKPGAHGHR